MSERHEYYAKSYGPGRVTIAECDVCGWLTWVSSDKAANDVVVVVPLSTMHTNQYCQPCTEIAMRAPEMARWVLNVVAKSRSANE